MTTKYIYGWGVQNDGQLGLGHDDLLTAPALIGQYVAIFTSSANTHVLDAEGRLWGAGSNLYGTVGNGQIGWDQGTQTYVQEATGSTLWTVNAHKYGQGAWHGLAIRSNGRLFSWGSNWAGQCGQGTQDDNYPTPTQVGTWTSWQQVSAGSSWSMGRTLTWLYTWGSGGYYRTGQGHTDIITTPTQLMSDVADCACGNDHGLCIKSDGTLWAWGRRSMGQVGDGVTDNYNHRETPVQIGSFTDWQQVAGGGYHSAGIRDGRLYTWGSNSSGQLGLGDTNLRNAPTQVGSATNWVKVVCGASHTVALNSAGEVWITGENTDGRLGLGHSNSVTALTQVPIGTGWESVDANNAYTIAIRDDPMPPPNEPPAAPSSLQTEGQTNPTGLTNLTPDFTAIYNDPDAGDEATHIYIQVGTTSGGSDMWDSGWLSITNVNEGNRCGAITYNGTALSLDGTQYHWRCRFRDLEGADGAWSTETATFTMATLSTESGSFTANATILKEQSASIAADAALQATVSEDFAADATLLAEETGSFTADAFLYVTQIEQITADAAILKAVLNNFDTDAALIKEVQASFTASSWIWTGEGWFTADAIIIAEEEDDFTADSVILGAHTEALTADAVLLKEIANSITSDAAILGAIAASFTSDAALMGSESGSFTADAFLVQTVLGSFTADATLALGLLRGWAAGGSSLSGILSTSLLMGGQADGGSSLSSPILNRIVYLAGQSDGSSTALGFVQEFKMLSGQADGGSSLSSPSLIRNIVWLMGYIIRRE